MKFSPDEIIFFLAGVTAAFALLLIRIAPRCRVCESHIGKANYAGGTAAAYQEQIVFLRGTLDRLLVNAGVVRTEKTPEQVQADKEDAEEAKRRQHILDNGGDIHGD